MSKKSDGTGIIILALLFCVLSLAAIIGQACIVYGFCKF